MARFRLASVFLLAILVFFAASPALSQVSIAQAQLNGTVRDQTGSLIVKATVTLRDVDTNRVYTTASNNTGYYILANLPPGNYELTAEAPGFGKYRLPAIVLTVGQVATVDIGMKVAQASEEL